MRLTDDEVATLGEGRAVVRDEALAPGLALGVAQAVRGAWEEGLLSPAGIGHDGRRLEALRSDWTTWLTEVGLEGPLADLWTVLEAQRREAHEAAWLGLQRFSVQLACYPGGATRYVRHRDAFADDPARRLTAILYLNPDWEPDHGGRLRVFTPEGPRDVAPRLGRLVLFLSDRLEHEVLPVHAPRFAATAWFQGPSAIPLLEDPIALAPEPDRSAR